MIQVLGDSGPTVLLIPGGAEAVDGFFPGIVEGLIADPGCRVILYDRPGAGASDVDGGLADASDAVHEAIAGLGPVVAIGQSLGGAVALLLAIDHPADVAGLVLLDPTPINDPALARKVAKRMRTTLALSRLPLLGRLLTAALRSSVDKIIRRDPSNAEVRTAALQMVDLELPKLARAVLGIEDISDDFDPSRLPVVPAVVVTADRKPTSAIRQAHERLAASLGGTLVSWPEAEHAVHLTHPHEVLGVSREIVRAASDR